MTKLFSESFGQGPNLVLLHGWGIHSGIWQFVIPKLSKEFRITSIDLPGFGRSKALEDNSIENIITYILDVAPSKAHWIGWSLGGLLATRIASKYPDRVEKLICVASSPKFLKTNDWPGIDLTLLEQFANQLDKDYVGTLTRFLFLQFYGTKQDKEMMRWLQSNLFLYGKPTMCTLKAGLTILQTLDCREELKTLSCKVLYLLGRLDTLVPAQLTEALQDFPSHVETVLLPKASHAIFLTHEQEFLNQVRSFTLK